MLQVDLTEYVEKHEFVFDAVLNEEVSNDEVITAHEVTWYFDEVNVLYLWECWSFLSMCSMSYFSRCIVKLWSLLFR